MGKHPQLYGTAPMTVDVASLEADNFVARKRAADHLFEVLSSNGFMYVAGHGVPEMLLDSVYEQAATFFARDEDDKNRYYIGNQRNHRGYVPKSERGDYSDEDERRYEAFDMGPGGQAADYDSANPLAGPNVYPDQPGFRMVIGRYLNEMRRVSYLVATGIALALDLPEDFFWQQMTNPDSQLRLLHYTAASPASVAGPNPVGMGGHTDYEAFTILHSRNPGLQVLNIEGDWIDAEPVAGTFYFNIGDLMEAWTGGLLKATPHRVIDHGVERYSLPYFCAANHDTVVAPVPVPGLEHRQANYEPFVAGHHLVSQLERDFPYLRRRPEVGERDSWFDTNPFEARMREMAS